MDVISDGEILKEIEPGVFNESYFFEDIKVEFNFNVYE